MVTFVGLLLVSLAWAEELVLRLSSSQLEVGQSTSLIVEAIDVPLTRPPSVPTGEGIFVQLDSSTPSRMFESVNFKSRRIVRYHYSIIAMKPGRWSVGPVSAAAQKRTLVAKSVEVEVRPKAGEQAASIQVSGELSRPEPYVGEVVVYTFHYQSGQSVVGQNWKAPTFTGLRNLPGLNIEQKTGRKRQNGKTLETIDIMIPLVAADPGPYVVSSASMLVKVPKQQKSDDFFSRSSLFRYADAQTHHYTVAKKDGLVQPLPEAPADFSGLVGDFSLQASVDKKRVSVGDSVTLQLTLAGNGSLSGYRFPELSISNAQMYTDLPQHQVSYATNGIASTLQQSYALVALKPGELRISPLQIRIFQPQTASYVVLQSQDFLLHVEAGQTGNVALQSFEKMENAQKDQPFSLALPKSKIGSGVYWRGHSLWLLPLLMGGLLVGKMGWQRYSTKQTVTLHFPVALPADPQQRLQLLSQYFLQVVAVQQNTLPAQVLPAHIIACGPAAVEIKEQLDRARFGDGKTGDVEAQIKAFGRTT